MKKIISSSSLFFSAAIALYLFCLPASGIKGSVAPAANAGTVWAISGTDSLKTTPVEGAFFLEAKAGTYKLVIEGKSPYKTYTKENVVVPEGQTLDLGIIALEQ